MIELGYPDFVLNARFGVVAPAGTPKAVVAKLNAEFAKAARDPEVVAKMAEQGAKMMTGTPEEFASLMRSETIRLGKVVRESGAHRTEERHGSACCRATAAGRHAPSRTLTGARAHGRQQSDAVRAGSHSLRNKPRRYSCSIRRKRKSSSSGPASAA